MKRSSVILASIIAFAVAPSVHATAFSVTYSGTVSNDIYGNFLGNGLSASGYAYTATYLVDPATPGTTVHSSPGLNDIFGNSPSDPIVSFTLIINGKSFTTPVASGSRSTFGEDNQVGFSGFSIVADAQDETEAANYFRSSFSVTSFSSMPVPPAVYGGNGAYAVQSGDTAGGEVKTSNSGSLTDVQLAVDTVTYSNLAPAAVPEPASWILMLAGFGLTGAAMRRSNRSVGSVIAA